ncbi:MAG: translation initiation factor [Bacteroidetes bacterium]|nr:translation initiation factor [Bacteroidota bacterium]
MSIRLSKACKDLNVGMTTAVEFLAKKGHKLSVDPNLKLSDELYLLLAKEFNKDMALKMESERLSQERHSKEKAGTVALEGYLQSKTAVEKPVEKPADIIRTTIPKDQIPHIKAVGHIDLDGINKPAAEGVKQTEAPVVEEVTVETPQSYEAPEVIEETRIEEPVVVETIEPQIKEDIIPEKVEIPAIEVEDVPEATQPVVAEIHVESPVEVKTEPVAVQEEEVFEPENDEVKNTDSHNKDIELNDDDNDDEDDDVNYTSENENDNATEVEDTEVSDENEVFSLSRPKIEKKPVVIGTIDLNLLNQSTRPKPKTKEQKRKEREEKNRQLAENKKTLTLPGEKKVLNINGPDNANSEALKKKKRERFTSQKVDINKVQQPGNAGTGNNLGQPKKATLATNTGKKDNRLKKPLKTVVDEEAVQKQIKETLARLAGGNKKGKGAKYRKDKREIASARLQEQAERDQAEESVLKLTEFVTVSELAVMMDISVNQVIATCMSIGMMVSINQRLDAETINIVAEEFGFTTQFVSADVVEAIGEEEPDSEEDLLPRAPIVTVMGHVDHGKTSLLDYIRKTNVIAGEAGGITQHIGAYNVKLDNGQRITFLDTPGHEAFTAMRARGAKVTDIAIIIVAADDNVMPQTIEAINHASAANVPMIFAINKVDKPGANPEKIKETLAGMNYLVEDWGGKYQSQDISAKQGLGISELLEKVLLEAELLELKANPEKRAVGSVIESSLDKGRGYISTILVQNGTLHQGDVVLAGTHFGKIKAMFNERNQRIKEAKPAEPVLILGLNGAPQAGDNFNVMATEQEAREIANKREQLQREQSLRTKKHFTLDELGRRIALGDFKELNVIVKGDVDGSVEALSDSLLKLSTEHIQVNVIHKAVGAISDSDVLLAAASNAIICGFQVRPTSTARKMAEKEEIDVRLYSIIYDAIEEIKAAMEGMLSPEIKEEITATLEVIETFKITKVGTVAGCLVREGKIKRNNKVRIIRDGIVVYTGELDSLKRFKEDVKEVGTNYECGLNIKNYNDLRVGDLVESFEETEIKKTL